MTAIKAIMDGREIVAQQGQTILQAAKANSIHIPTLCYHPAIAPYGACRLCLVQIKNNPKLLPSCTTEIVEGMNILTQTPDILEARKSVIELILVRHPLDCFSCKRNGACELQNVAYELGVEQSRYAREGKINRHHTIEQANPFYMRDMNKCILCARCIRTCSELAHYHAIDFHSRGIQATVNPPLGKSLETSDCTFCGQCVQNCPVGALFEKPSIGLGRAWELQKKKTICAYCGVGCELEISVNAKSGKIANITTNYESPTSLNKGRSCVKGRFSWQFVHSEERLKHPLIREEGVLREATWEEALQYTAKKLLEIKQTSGPDSLGIFSSARCTNEENYLIQRFARQVLGTNNVDHCAHL